MVLVDVLRNRVGNGAVHEDMGDLVLEEHDLRDNGPLGGVSQRAQLVFVHPCFASEVDGLAAAVEIDRKREHGIVAVAAQLLQTDAFRKRKEEENLTEDETLGKFLHFTLIP